jgi:hypothetical protein
MFLILSSGRVEALGPTEYMELLAWSDDGTSAVLENRAGSRGTFEYVIVSGEAPHHLSFVPSAVDDCTGRQQIPQAKCAACMAKLEEALRARGFSSVSLLAELCAKPRRAGPFLTVSAEMRDQVRSSRRAGRAVRHHGLPRCGALSPTGKLLIVIARLRVKLQTIGAWFSRSGDALQRLELGLDPPEHGFCHDEEEED